MKKSKIIIVIIAVLIATSGLIGLYLRNKTNEPVEPVILQGQGINLEPPSENEANAGDEKKQEIAKEQDRTEETTETANDSKETVDIVIVDASQYEDVIEVRSFIQGIVPDGYCTVTFTSAESIITKSVPAKADASTTTCAALSFPSSDLSLYSSWDVTITYENENLKGSASSTIMVSR